MDKEKEIVKRDGSLGSIRIADEVVSIIAGLAATEVDGIAGMSGGIAGGIAEMLGRKNFAKVFTCRTWIWRIMFSKGYKGYS